MAATLFLSILFTLLVTGAVLLKIGRWPPRVADTPHCPVRLHHLGRSVAMPRMRHGCSRRQCGARRPSSPTRSCSGRCSDGWFRRGLLLSSIPSFVYDFDWNRHLTLSWLLPRLTNPNSPAWTEIQRRIDNNLLSETIKAPSSIAGSRFRMCPRQTT